LEDGLVSAELKRSLLWICMGLILLGGCKNSMLGKGDVSGTENHDPAACWEEADRLYDAGRQPAALALYLRCADDGHAEAQYIAGHMLLFGDGVRWAHTATTAISAPPKTPPAAGPCLKRRPPRRTGLR
jgi:hypothetical protein